jgi:hypothetical protein
MNDHGPRDAREALPARPVSSPTAPAAVESSRGAGNASPSPPASSPRAARLRVGIVAAALMCAVIGLSAACATSTSATAIAPSSTAVHPGHGNGSSGGGSNARSGPASGGASGTVDSVSKPNFTMTTPAGQKVTVNTASSTTYQNGTSPTSASAITTGQNVLVLGTTSGTTIMATQVILQPPGSGGSASASAAGVVPFQHGAPAPSKQVGQIPDYTEGEGTIVSGTTANEATQAALAAYPGGVVDRVVQLSSGEYEVHNIGVNWPHHVFVNPDSKVVGAE